MGVRFLFGASFFFFFLKRGQKIIVLKYIDILFRGPTYYIWENKIRTLPLNIKGNKTTTTTQPHFKEAPFLYNFFFM